MLIRHTRVDVAPGVCYGQTDVPLAAAFEAEAAEARAHLPWAPVEIWSSPATRCMRLARFFGDGNIHADPRLWELNFGEWENRAWESFHSPQSEAWARDPVNLCPPGGESGGELHRRVGEVRGEILARIAADASLRVAVVTHAGVIRSWLAHARGCGLLDLFNEPVPHGIPVSGD